ncbi:MAG: DUF533 domain-containing protein [Pseudomonadota bacterium]
MSLMKTVTKLAIGYAMAKGVGAIQQRGGVGAVMKDLQTAASEYTAQASATGGLGGMLSHLTGGQSGGSGGLGDILGQLTGGQSGNAAGLESLLGKLGTGNVQTAGLGGLGGLLGELAGARGGGAASDFEALLNEDNPPSAPEDDAMASIMLRAIIQAAKADGDVDADETSKLIEALEDGDAQDVQMVQDLMKAPVDAAGLASDTPKGLESQVYTLSVNAIQTDNMEEARYLHSLAEGLGLAPDKVNKIHDGMGAPRIYR